MFKIFLGLTAAAGLAAAATSPISSAAVAKPSVTPGESSCSSAVNNILASSDPGIGCIAPHGLTQIYAQTQQNASVPVLTTAIDSWLTSMCSVGSCSAGCGSSFDETPLPNATALASTLYLSYFDVREMMCLQKYVTSFGFMCTLPTKIRAACSTANKNTFCMTELLNAANIEAFDLSAPEKVIEQLVFAAFNLECNECTKAAFKIYSNTIPGINGTALLESKCGATFTSTLAADPASSINETATLKQFNVNGVSPFSAPTASVLILTTVALFFTLL
ncbi:hypothetical protein B0H11DRAFT_1984123 [Mycena galericulata]|nr:hypothetical protein B0H11DRAFT_1984123 [Mycena galericulata]